MPHLVLMIDAADMGDEPGGISILAPQDARGFSASSHTLPLSVLAEYLHQQFNCQTLLCCIQPLSLEFTAGLSLPVKKSVDQIVAELVSLQIEEMGSK